MRNASAPGSRPGLSVAEDVREDRARSVLPDLPTVGDMRTALTAIEAWAATCAATAAVEPEGLACFQIGAQTCLSEWVAHTRHLLRKLPDASIAVEVPHAAVAAMHEVASFAVHVADAHDLDPGTAPYTRDFMPAEHLSL